MLRYRSRWIAWGVLGVLVGCQPAAQPRLARIVVLISLDGATPAGIEAAATPNLHTLMATGAQSHEAHSVPPYKTLPCHVSMLTGVEQARHGIEQNGFTDPLPAVRVPTLFDAVDRAGLDALMLTGKYKLLTLRSGHYAPLEQVGTLLRRETRHHVPDFIFIHSAQPDAAGHADGWGSPAYLDALARDDAMVGNVVDWLRTRGVWDRALIIVSADHGGHEKTHTGEQPEDTVIPWIVAGGAVRSHALPDGLRITDIAPTILQALGLPLPANLDGAPVRSLFETVAQPVR
jgi:predicted AlkP superfamily pyrophosphatase or phosphodiesterase